MASVQQDERGLVKALQGTACMPSVQQVVRPNAFHPRSKNSMEAGGAENKCSNICSNMGIRGKWRRKEVPSEEQKT